VALFCATPEEAARWAATGARMIVLSSEVTVLHRTYSAPCAELLIRSCRSRSDR
jgi:2-keto-3-deoxy-L-rhamnonate aldolase RhmA